MRSRLANEVALLEEKRGVISGGGQRIRSAFEVTAHLVDPLQRYQVLQQRYYEVMQCWEVALRQNNRRWYKTMRRLDAIRMELKQAMMFEVGRMA